MRFTILMKHFVQEYPQTGHRQMKEKGTYKSCICFFNNQELCMLFQDLDNKGEEYVGTYTCEADNGYSKVEVEAKLTTPDGAGTARKFLFLI